MPEIRTDDGPRKLRAVWLGPDGSTLPFEWTYVQWAVCLVSIPLVSGLVTGIVAALYLVADARINWLVAVGFGVIYGLPTALYLGVKIMRGVTFDEPLRHKRFLARSELGRADRRRQARPTEWVMPWPVITDLNPIATDGEVM